MYKIAVACEKRNISKHYSKCLKYKVFTVEDNKITKVKNIRIKEFEQEKLPKDFSENNIKYVMCGAIGDLARKLFCDNGIEIIMDASGNCRQAVIDFINSELTVSSLCSVITEKEDQ